MTHPPRSILYARPVPPEQGGGVEVACDCATVTQIVIDGLENLAGPREMAFTCGGCQSVHWFTVSPPQEQP